MHYLRLLLLPFSFLYGFIIWIRNKLYDTGFFSSHRFNLPVISIGNLAIGGAGKSPMAEYIIRLLKDHYKVAVLSRGYKRETKGFRLVDVADTASSAGDEPLQFKRKFTNITVAVAEKRVEGIEQLQKEHDVIILDDAFQHRAVTPGLSILIFDYTRLSDFLFILPAGNLREPFHNRKRADVLVISKCPESLSEIEMQEIRKRVDPFKHQRLFFSYLKYGDIISVNSGKDEPLSVITAQTTVFLVTGIANPIPLLNKLKTFTGHIIHYNYPDHHVFSIKNIIKLVEEFNGCASAAKLILTTEKDAQRLLAPTLLELLRELPVYYLPVETKIYPEEEKFNYLIEKYAKGSLYNNPVH